MNARDAVWCVETSRLAGLYAILGFNALESKEGRTTLSNRREALYYGTLLDRRKYNKYVVFSWISFAFARIDVILCVAS